MIVTGQYGLTRAAYLRTCWILKCNGATSEWVGGTGGWVERIDGASMPELFAAKFNVIF